MLNFKHTFSYFIHIYHNFSAFSMLSLHLTQFLILSVTSSIFCTISHTFSAFSTLLFLYLHNIQSTYSYFVKLGIVSPFLDIFSFFAIIRNIICFMSHAVLIMCRCHETSPMSVLLFVICHFLFFHFTHFTGYYW